MKTEKSSNSHDSYQPLRLSEIQAEKAQTEDIEQLDLCNLALDLQADLCGLGERIRDLRTEIKTLETRFRTIQKEKTAIETRIMENRSEIKKIHSTPRPSRKSREYKSANEKTLEALKNLSEHQKILVAEMLKEKGGREKK